MKLVIDKNVLHKSLSHILGVVERRNTIPILSNLKITIDSNQPNSVFFTATDMDISITEGLEASTEGEGSFTVPAHILHDIVRKLPDVDITFSYNNDDSNKKLILSANKSRFTLPVLSAEEFPEIAMNDISHTFTIDKKSLSKLLDKSRFAISTEETRYYLNGVYLHHTTANDNRQVLRVVSTDGHRLASIQIDLPDGAADMPSIIVPRKAVFEIRKILEEENNELLLNLEISESKIKLSFNNTILISKLIDGSFPDYTRVIPQDNNITLNTAIKPLNEAIDRVATIASDKSKSINNYFSQ